jgi:ATP-binding cassette subfamily B protein
VIETPDRASRDSFGSPPPSVGVWIGLREVYRHMSAARRRQFLAVLVLMLVGGITEVATIGSVIPFLALLSAPGSAGNLGWPTEIFLSLARPLGISGILAAGLVFVLLAIFSGAVRLLLTRTTQEFIYRLGHELAVETQRRILDQPYSFHLHSNSSTLIAIIDKIEILVLDLVLPLMQTLTSGVIAACIVIGLIYIDPLTALIAAASFSIIYISISAATAKRLAANSAVVGSGFHERLKIIQESLGGIRDVIIDDSQPMYLRLFARVNARLATARATTAFIAAAPRYFIESVGMIVIAAVAIIVSGRQGGIGAALPFLGAIALGAQRLLPLIQSVYNGWSTAAGHRSIVAQVIDFLRLPARRTTDASAPPLPFHEHITFEKVSFSYPTRNADAVHDVSFEIPVGSMVAVIGETGSGKTTLVDLLMGLLQPTEGSLRIDGAILSADNAARWQRQVAHVPQSVFLADTTIARNIALSLDDEPIDMERIIRAAEVTQLHEFVSSLSESYDTVIGERGIRLSGGQRQRLGLARAIYKDTPLLVLDEATSALDEGTEAAVMEGIEKLAANGRTIVMIAHRRSSIIACDLVVRLHNGRLAEFGTLAEVATLPAPARRLTNSGRRRGRQTGTDA